MPRHVRGGVNSQINEDHIVVEVENDFTPHADVLNNRTFGQAVKYHSQVKPTVDKRKA
jgi:hypothetical protein